MRDTLGDTNATLGIKCPDPVDDTNEEIILS